MPMSPLRISVFSLALGLPGFTGAEVQPIGSCRTSDHGGFNATNFFLNKRPVPGADSICNDGSAAQFYFRPCCNGPTHYDFCNVSVSKWLVVFGDGNEDGWCWDAESCAARMASGPALTGSSGLPYQFTKGDGLTSIEGAFSKGGETNPNFYSSYAVYVPYCSSDLFLGECEEDGSGGDLPPFCGKSIVKNALAAILPEMAMYGADDIVLVGGAGVMSYIDELVDILPSSAAVSAICDGCVLFDDVLPGATAPDSCSSADAFSCTPDKTLPSAVELWGASLEESCGGWSCLLSTAAQGQNGLIGRTAAKLPLLAQHPQFDAKAFRARGAVPGANALLDSGVQSSVLAGLKPAQVVVTSSCSTPQSAFLTDSFYHVTFGFFLPPGNFASGLFDIVYNPQNANRYANNCVGYECNQNCPAANVATGSVQALVV